MSILFVDVSHHDWDRRGGNLDWAKVRAATSPVMCARATYGDPSGYNPTTRYFADLQDGARAAGFTLRGGYHNLVRGDAASIARQVGYFRRALDSEGCQWAMLDIERYPELVSRDLWPRWEDVCRFRDAWAMVDDRPLVYYLPRWLWAGYYGGANLAELRGPLVASDYGSNTTAAPGALYASRGGDYGKGWDGYGGTAPAIWQYGSQCDVPGASSNTDINAFRGSLAELTALLTGDGDMADTEGATAEQYRMLALLTLDPKWANDPHVVEAGRMTSVPLIDLLKRLDAAAAQLTARVPADLVARLQAILAAAQDDGTTAVTMDPATLAEFEAAVAALKAVHVPTANENADVLAKRLVG